MPTPVTTARQCLTEEAARVLDDAVSVAKRRNHAQTTSLHAISSLLSPSFSLLRDALSRIRSSAYSTRLQFRALELCVGVSLDRLPSSKSSSSSSSSPQNGDSTPPPISNSLMAAIKRSQAHQRRQPEMYHLTQIHSNSNHNTPISISSIKVELKHFVLSILDDPIVSRVFGDAGFRSSDIKLAIIHPPVPTTTRLPPLFLCNFMDFPGFDENCRRIGEVLVKEKERNPLLVGVCANVALARFKECLQKGRFGGFPKEIIGLKLVCLETEIREFLRNGNKEGLDMKLKEVRLMVESCCSGPGIVVNFGELKVLMEGKSADDHDVNDDDHVKELVLKLSGLVEVYGKKVWLIGAAASDDTYSIFLGRFPTVMKDWDLHPLPIASSIDGLGSKSSLMGSFVPFGGFFPMASDFITPLTSMKQPFTRCSVCNEKYEHEVCALLREASSVSMSLPSWLQRAGSEISKGGDVLEQVKDVASNEKISVLQKKWDEHCRHHHQSPTIPTPGSSLAGLQVPPISRFQFITDKQGGSSSSSSGDSSLNDTICSNSGSAMQMMQPNISPQQQVMTAGFPRKVFEMSGCHPSERESPALPTYPNCNLSLHPDHKPLSTVPFSTDLGLGTIYATKYQELKKPILQDHQVHLQHCPVSFSSSRGIASMKDNEQIAQSPLPAGPSSGEELNPGDYKLLFRKLSEVVAWQGEAISKISEIVSSCRNRNGNKGQSITNIRRNIWLSFLGPDKIGKKRITEALADAIFGSGDRLIAVDLISEDRISKANSLFLCQRPQKFDINFSRMTVVDHIVQELSKKPNSVVFLENINEADPLLQNSLSRAIQTGKFRDSRGRETSLNNVIFVTTSSMTKDDKDLSPRKEFIKFSEEKVLRARNWQMQIAIRTVLRDARRSSQATVSLVSSSKRKVSDTTDTLEVEKRVNKTSKNSLDLNLPLEEIEEEAIDMGSYDSDFLSDGSSAWLEDFFAQLDGNVVFKPFDFDELADKLLRKMHLNFKETMKGERISLEIDHEVMVQTLAATWFSDRKGAVEEWIKLVLGKSFAEARERNRLTAESVVRLSSCEGVPVEKWASGICLPTSINLCV